jgi:hypothetical protein
MDFSSLDFKNLVNVGASFAFERSVDTACFEFDESDTPNFALASNATPLAQLPRPWERRQQALDRRLATALATADVATHADEVVTADVATEEIATADVATHADEVATADVATDEIVTAGDVALMRSRLLTLPHADEVAEVDEVAQDFAADAQDDPYAQVDEVASQVVDEVDEAHDSDELSDGVFGQELRALSWEHFKKRKGRPRGGVANRPKSVPFVVAPRPKHVAPPRQHLAQAEAAVFTAPMPKPMPKFVEPRTMSKPRPMPKFVAPRPK